MNTPADSRPPIPAEYPVAKNAAHLLAENACVFFGSLLEVLSARQRPRLIRKMGKSIMLGVDGVADVPGNHLP